MTGSFPAVPPSPGGVRRRLLPWSLRGLAVLGLAVLLFSPARLGLDPTLDHSNYGTYAWFVAHEAQYGRDVLPMAGPYGFVPYGFLYAGHLFGERLVLELLTKAGLAALLLWFFARAGGVVRWVWLAAVVLMTPLAEDLTYDLAILFAGFFLLERFIRREAGLRWPEILPDLAVAAFLGLLTLFKGTHAVLSLATFGLLAALAAWRRDFARLGVLAATYVTTIVVLLLAAGQNPLHLPAYLRGILELSSGYNDAMVLDEPLLAFLTGAGAFLSLEIGVLVALFARRREPAAWPALVLFALFAFVEWKHGFVRADGHVYIFYQFACLAAPTLWLLLRGGRGDTAPTRPFLVGGAVLASVAAALGLLGDRPAALPRHLWVVEELPRRLAASATQLLAPGRAKRELNEDLKHRRRVYDLPQVREVIGDRPIDFFGTEHGYLLLNQFNYRPRPMGGGSFNVFTPWLQDRNRSRVTSLETRPAHFLVRLETIDERFVAQDDPGTLRALLEGYAPVQAEQGMLLFAVRPEAAATPPAPRPLGTRAARLGEDLAVPGVGPDELLAIEIRAPLNLAGRLRRLLYKPPPLYADLLGDDLEQPGARRIVPRLFNRPVPASPVLENNHDLLNLYRGVPGKRLRGLRLYTADPHWFEEEALSVAFFALPRPPRIPEATGEALRQKLDFPIANRLPLEVAAAVARINRHEGLAVQALEPPGVMRFPVGPGDNSVRFVYGLLPAAYERHGTDGVEFIVEFAQEGQPPRELFRRLLRPRSVPADRGLQVETVPLPPDPGAGTVALRTDIGPDRDGAWDWAFYSGVHLGSGGFLPLQFPGFSLLPDRVESTTSSVGLHEDRRVLLAHAPSRLEFTLDGRARLLEFGGGLLPGAYGDGGGSDGVEFIVTLIAPDGSRGEVFRRHLNPRDVADDRGSPAFAVALPSHPAGTRLELAVTGGPAGNISWDWSYLEGFRLR